MNLQQLKDSLPARATRPQGFWVPYAWLVRSIVEQSEGGRVATDAVRTVLANEGLPLTAANERTLRVAYYGIREKDWPIVVVPPTEPEEVPPGDVPPTEPEEVPPGDVPPTEPEKVPPTDDEEFALDEELRLELEREISEGFIPDPED